MVKRSRNTEDLIADLYYLRKGEGFTPGRVRHAGILIDILGGPEQTYELMRERLLAAIDTLGPDKALLLRTAFNIEPTVSGNTLKQRRALYGQAISRKVDTVTNRENRALEDLIVPLLTERYALSPYGESASLMHADAIQMLTSYHTVVENGYWVSTTEHYKTQCLYEGAEYLDFNTDTPSSLTTNSPLKVETIQDGKGQTNRFYAAKPYHKGQIIDTEFTLQTNHEDERTEKYLTEESRAYHVPTIASVFQVDFIGQQPATVWYYQKKTYFQRPGTPDSKHQIQIKNGTAAIRFRHLHGGLWAGIAWQWD